MKAGDNTSQAFLPAHADLSQITHIEYVVENLSTSIASSNARLQVVHVLHVNSILLVLATLQLQKWKLCQVWPALQHHHALIWAHSASYDAPTWMENSSARMYSQPITDDTPSAMMTPMGAATSARAVSSLRCPHASYPAPACARSIRLLCVSHAVPHKDVGTHDEAWLLQQRKWAWNGGERTGQGKLGQQDGDKEEVSARTLFVLGSMRDWIRCCC